MNLQTVKISDLKFHPKNPNTHPEFQVKELQNSLGQFDQVKNIVVWQNLVIAGNGLMEAARLQNRETIEIQDVSDWPEEKALKFMVADNRLAQLAVMDDDALIGLLENFDNPLDIPGVDENLLDGLGCGEDDIEILDSDGNLSGGQYGLVGSSTKVPVSILGIGGLVDRDIMEQAKAKLISIGAVEGQDNGEKIKEFLLKGLS